MTTAKTKTPQATFRDRVTGYAKCLEDHPPLPIGEYLVYGGSCNNPVVTNADVYIGFDMSMTSPSDYPWDPKSPGTHVYYPIQDRQTPRDPEGFKRMIEWLAVQLIAQKIVHLGCIGGHGRTGLVLAALYCHMTGDKDAITYVRKHYCTRAVESAGQVQFLHVYFGIEKVAGADEVERSRPITTRNSQSALWTAATPVTAPLTKISKPAQDAPGQVFKPFTVIPNRRSAMALKPSIDNAAKPDTIEAQSMKGKD